MSLKNKNITKKYYQSEIERIKNNYFYQQPLSINDKQIIIDLLLNSYSISKELSKLIINITMEEYKKLKLKKYKSKGISFIFEFPNNIIKYYSISDALENLGKPIEWCKNNFLKKVCRDLIESDIEKFRIEKKGYGLQVHHVIKMEQLISDFIRKCNININELSFEIKDGIRQFSDDKLNSLWVDFHRNNAHLEIKTLSEHKYITKNHKTIAIKPESIYNIRVDNPNNFLQLSLF